jgi:hypothetical protein
VDGRYLNRLVFKREGGNLLKRVLIAIPAMFVGSKQRNHYSPESFSSSVWRSFIKARVFRKRNLSRC